jgi:uncharacterized protein YhdP
MRRAGHIAFAVGAVALVLTVALWQLHRYLASREVAAHVASRLEASLGIPVKVAEVDAGVRTTSLEGIELFEPGADKSSKPWATIERAEVDLPSWDLLRGETQPRAIALHGVTVRLRHDWAGQPMTRLPRPEEIIKALPESVTQAEQGLQRQIPEFHIESGRLVFEQPGHPDLVIAGIRGDVRNEEGRPVLTGTVDDPDWGRWALSGRLSPDSRACSASLRSMEPVPIRRTALDQIPFVDRSLWDQIEVQGESPAEIAFRYDPETQTVSYHAAFEPTALFLRVPAYDLRMQHVHGKITLENNVIHLDGLHGELAGGEVEGHGDLRFTNTLLKLRVAVDVRNLDTKRLPREWDFPPEVTGRLSGHADLRTTIREDRAVFHGQGHGTIVQAHVALVPTKPIPVEMTADASGFRFSVKRSRDR